MRAQRNKTADCVRLAQRVLNQYPRESLLKANATYDFNFEASPEDNLTWTNFRRLGYMNVPELKELSRWKARGRQQANIASNSGKAVKTVTYAATQVNSGVPEEPSLPVGILTTLQGVDIPMASTIMAVWDPQRFGILDIRVWQALGKAAPDAFSPLKSRKGNRRPFRLREADTYLRLVREIAVKTGLTCREIDKALWVIGEQNA